jgi:glucose/mannose transport system substrate-binding protein
VALRKRLAVLLFVAPFVASSHTFAAPVAPVAPPAASKNLTFYHWWTSPSESAALGALVKLFHEKYPDVVVTPTLAPNGGNAQAMFAAIRKLKVQKQTPAAFQMFAGYAAQVFFDGGLLAPIDDLWAAEHLDGVIPPVIRDLNKIDGHYYSVPVDVHRTNVVWYNKALLDKYAIDPDTLTTWDAFFAAAGTLKAKGVAAPIQMATNWTALTVFEGIMASQGIGTYEDWINGKITAPDDPRLIKALATLQKYLAYVNKDSAGLGWDVAVHRVMNGDGAFCTMGDWANGEFRVAHLKYGKDYGTLLLPGTKGMFGLGVDTFQHPSGIADETNARRWLALAASREGQDAFNPLKGSISARGDADVTRYDPYQRTAILDLKASSSLLYPTVGSAVPEAFNSHVLDAITVFVADQDVDKAAAAIASIAAKLTGRYSRTWHLH